MLLRRVVFYWGVAFALNVHSILSSVISFALRSTLKQPWCTEILLGMVLQYIAIFSDLTRLVASTFRTTKTLSYGNHVTILQLLRGSSARLGSALGRGNPVEQTGLCIYRCFGTYRSELLNRVLSNQQTDMDGISLRFISTSYQRSNLWAEGTETDK
jgi:hypothetical protein